MAYEPIHRWKQQLGGAFIALLGGGFTAWGWYTALTWGYYYGKASMLAPAFFILGLGMILFRSYKEERIARGEDISDLSGLQLLTARWWVVLSVPLPAGLGNYALLSLE
jgi:ABC-type Fe3+-siderophore transport system permease subunit